MPSKLPKDQRKRQPEKAPKHTPIKKLLAQKALDPLLTHKQLAEINNVSQPAISMMLKRYGINSNYLESFKKNRADIMAGIQEEVLSSLSDDDIKKASIRDKTILYGTLYDKERLERGQSTSNHAISYGNAVVRAAQRAAERVEGE